MSTERTEPTDAAAAPDAPADHRASQSTPREELAVRVATFSILLSVLGAIGFVLAWVTLHDSGWQTQALGLTAVVALGGIGVGLVVWAQGAMPQGPHVQDRTDARMGSTHIPDDVRATLRADTEQIQRRSLLARVLTVALGALGLSALVPLLSLGPTEEDDTEGATDWAAGLRLSQARNAAPSILASRQRLSVVAVPKLRPRSSAASRPISCAGRTMARTTSRPSSLRSETFTRPDSTR